MLTEINFDGIVGPSHNYAGLSFGNLAAMRNAGQVSHPRAAALRNSTSSISERRTCQAIGMLLSQASPNST